MTYPCVDEDHFQVIDGELTPQPYMQWRHVATNTAAAHIEMYDVNGGNQAEDLFELQVSWTNPHALSMHVYGLLTRGGTTLISTARSRVYIDTYFGAASGTAPADPTASTLFGRMGNGATLGTVSSQAVYAVIETRQGERTSVLGDTVTLTTGQTYKLRVRLRFDGANWETAAINPTEAETELSINTGATRLDLYSYPSL